MLLTNGWLSTLVGTCRLPHKLKRNSTFQELSTTGSR